MFRVRFPFEGQVLVHKRYKGTSVTAALEKLQPGVHRVAHDMDLDVDFVTGPGACVVYLWDKDIINPQWKDIAKRVQAALTYPNPTVYAVAAPSTQPNLQHVRNNITCRFRLPVIFVATPEDLALYLIGAVKCAVRPPIKSSRQDLNLNLLTAIRLLPGVGEKRSMQLMHSFPSLQSLQQASKDELREMLGANGTKLWKMLHGKTPAYLFKASKQQT
ncbi:hypothetical protein PTSG_06556 [Salpingoeca rosetta]|uniref:ERCC4 domain-containing protein n=1 Tax=Salpingoeca rosetta (strain ATCC 50818 / BSB-021) TaxID=946362 RepID=F2UG54_SALR5|nr:uncharacterized protein PTSG_06556 [Salpingoeca rosetta]EGD75482.1 hypothetical protein PTSG_06556 [Salpingoeca rosetta]|eukprot:XP_004991939.1 hypothetical protein PTSG_06556 [Salpingoeca rosetta]